MRSLNNLLFILLIAVILIALMNILVSFIQISDFKERITGFASGYANITIYTSININVSRDSINWSAGTINAGELNATLYTSGENDGVVERGNWSSSGVKAFIIENTGNLNCSLSLQTDKNANDFFNSLTSSNEQYQWNVTNKEDVSCSEGAVLGTWHDVNKTSGGTKFCEQFSFKRDNNEIYVDMLLTVPHDSSNIGFLSDTITITGDVAG